MAIISKHIFPKGTSNSDEANDKTPATFQKAEFSSPSIFQESFLPDICQNAPA